ncbi:hypothetical protein G7054_g7064 [Neopestalotiopsis clavispora]|nr:hypothetical protein G7054_g7064 [Neopestalotiopsis clavispora]
MEALLAAVNGAMEDDTIMDGNSTPSNSAGPAMHEVGNNGAIDNGAVLNPGSPLGTEDRTVVAALADLIGSVREFLVWMGARSAGTMSFVAFPYEERREVGQCVELSTAPPAPNLVIRLKG